MLANLAPIPELYVSYESAQKLKVEAGDLISWDLTSRQICDLELLMNGGFNPLKGFLSEDDYNSVVDSMRLVDGTLWPMPINLDVSEDFAKTLESGQDIALRDQEGVILATMTVSDCWTPDKSKEAEKVLLSPLEIAKKAPISNCCKKLPKLVDKTIKNAKNSKNCKKCQRYQKNTNNDRKVKK